MAAEARRQVGIFVVGNEARQGEGGFIVPPAGYLSAVAEFAREHGIMLITDEIQAGLGRTGAMFAVGHEGVVRDLITTAGFRRGGAARRIESVDAAPRPCRTHRACRGSARVIPAAPCTRLPRDTDRAAYEHADGRR